MATTSMTTVDNILKEVYEPGINDQLQSEAKASKRIERSSEGIEHRTNGKYVRFAVRTKRNHGMGARSEGEALPVARTQSYSDTQVKLKYLYGSIELTGQTFELADKDFQAFATVLDQEVNGMKEGLAKDENRQVFGDGSGKLATATGAGTTTTFVTTDGRFLEEDMYVDIYQSGGTERVFNATISSVVESSGTYTVTFSPAAAVATASGDYIVRDGSLNKEPNGLANIIAATGVLHNINPATVGVWKSVIHANGGTPRSLTENLMIKLEDAIRIKGGGKPTVIFTSLGVRRAYFELLKAERRVVNTKEYTGGFTGLGFVTDNGETPVVSDVDAPPGEMQFVNEKELTMYQAGPWSFMNRDGSNWQRKIDSSGTYDAYQATLYKYAELATHRRNAHGRLDDITES